MKFYKKILISLFLFICILCVKNTSFGLTLSVDDFITADYFSGIPDLTLQTNTYSYLIVTDLVFNGLTPSISKVMIFEGYNPDDYLVLTNSTTLSNGTTNRLDGFNVSSNSLTSLICYTSILDNTWSSWDVTYLSDSDIVPRQRK